MSEFLYQKSLLRSLFINYFMVIDFFSYSNRDNKKAKSVELNGKTKRQKLFAQGSIRARKHIIKH